MRTLGFLFPFLLLSTSLFSQPNSARLYAMGNVSIAVPDAFGEAFINPARATRLDGIAIRLSPSLTRNSNLYEHTSSDNSGGSSQYKSEYSTSSLSLPADALMAIGPIHVGASFSRNSNSYTDSYYSKSTYSSSWNSDENKYEGSTPLTTYSALAALDLYVVQIGISGALFNSSGTSSSSSGSNSSSGSPYSNLSEQSNEYSGKSLRIGGSIGSSETFESGAAVFVGSTSNEQKPTRMVWNGVTQPLVDPNQYRSTESPKSFVVQSRLALTEHFVLGARVSGTSDKGEVFQKQRYYDPTNPNGMYEERKTGETEFSSTEIGAGVTWKTDRSLASVEFVLLPSTRTLKSILTTDYITYDQTYRRGSVSSESESKSTPKILRLGAEVGILESFVLRAGVETMWGTLEYSSKDVIYQSTSKTTGAPNSSTLGSGGFTLQLSLFRVDYAIVMTPYGSFYSGPYYYGISSDVLFTHYLSAQIGL